MTLRLPAVLLVAAAALLEVSFGDALSIYGIRPGFVFIAVYGLSVAGGEGKGLMYGAIGGLLEDSLSSGLMGLSLSGYAIAGYLAGRLGSRVFNIGEAANLLGIFILVSVQGLYTSIVLATFFPGYGIAAAMLRFGLPQALYNAAAGAVILWMVDGETAERHAWGAFLRRIEVRI